MEKTVSGSTQRVHFRAIQGNGFRAEQGQKVTFIAVQGQKGMQADESSQKLNFNEAPDANIRGFFVRANPVNGFFLPRACHVETPAYSSGRFPCRWPWLSPCL